MHKNIMHRAKCSRYLHTMFLVLFLVLCCDFSFAHKPNVCPNFEDYRTIHNNSKCWYDLAAEYNAPDIIRLLGYPVIEYKVPTKDGFILTMFRIPSDNVKNPRARSNPVYLQHGLVSTCANFVGLGQDSLAIVLADAGYDVWLGNYRGSQYSEEHMNLTVYDREYWDHSMDEIVIYDLPAMFRTILRNTDPNAQIIYIAHSLGTTLSLMYAAEFPEEAARTMKMMILMSPAYTLNNMRSPFKMGAPYGSAIVDMVNGLEMYRIVSQAEPLGRYVRTLCLESVPLMRYCLQMYNMFYGPNIQMGPEMIPVYFNQLPGGTALKILNHAADLVLGNFRKYNYQADNIKVYGTYTPPIYDLDKIHVPVYLIFSEQDWATTSRDAWNLWRNLPKRAKFGMKRINRPDFNHIDFIFGRYARKIVYNDLVRLLNKVVKN